QAVRHLVSLLYATGAFADVRVEATRGPAGLDLVIRPVAAPLFTRVELLGDRVLSRARFTVQAGPRARVGALSVTGAAGVTHELLVSMAGPGSGRPFLRSKAAK